MKKRNQKKKIIIPQTQMASKELTIEELLTLGVENNTLQLAPPLYKQKVQPPKGIDTDSSPSSWIL